MEVNLEMISKYEIISTTSTYNGIYFQIKDINDYADKIQKFGRSYSFRDHNHNLISYLLFYDNKTYVYLSMLWTNPTYRRNGYARKLLKKVTQSYGKAVLAEYNKSNPVGFLTKSLKFREIEDFAGKIKISFENRLSIMQPYFMPYIGYFNLIHSSSKMVFLDDVNFIKKGWINRNRIALNGKQYLFTIPLNNVSQNKKIFELKPFITEKFIKKFLNSIDYGYKKAPFYFEIKDLLFQILKLEAESISDLAIRSLISVSDYLGLEFNFIRSSNLNYDYSNYKKENRLIQICKDQNFCTYVNLINGVKLYNKKDFLNNNINLFFIEPEILNYKQGNKSFLPNLSIIDVLMYNDKEMINRMVESYKFI